MSTSSITHTTPKGTSVISHDGKLRGKLHSTGKQQATIELADGTTKRITTSKLSRWHHGPYPTPVVPNRRKARRLEVKASRHANRGSRANH